MKPSIPPILITFALVCFALVQNAQAVSPPPDGGYPGNNTAEGQNALLSLTTGVNNTAVGWFSLKSNTNGQLNTAVGAGTLFSTVHASRNTAIGGAALFSNTVGFENTAVGDEVLVSNTTGNANIAIGYGALSRNSTGGGNTAVGDSALFDNQSGIVNIALGFAAGQRTTGSNNIVIGHFGVADESNTIRIGGDVFGFGPQTAAFIAGISGTAVVGDAVVWMETVN